MGANSKQSNLLGSVLNILNLVERFFSHLRRSILEGIIRKIQNTI